MFMRMTKLGAIHIVTPSYNEKNINVPWKVTIKVIFQGWVETSFRVLNNVEKKEMIADWYNQTFPEYSFFTSIIERAGFDLHT